jgi:leucyl aminopeptidase (aminopeptidase T)
LKGRLIQELRLDFEKGRIKEFRAKKYEEVFREVFEATQGDRDKIAQFTLGLNPKVDLIGYTTDELSLGTVTIGVGANKGIGGKNDSSFSFSATITKPIVEIDGQTIMVDGRITL